MSFFRQTNHLLTLLFVLSATGYSEPLGSPDLEIALRGRADIAYFTDVESEDWVKDWVGFGHEQNMSLVTSRSSEHLHKNLSGQALEVFVKKGEFYGLSGKLVFKDKLGYEPEELYVRYYSYWVDCYRGGKQPAYHDHHVYLDNLVIATGKRVGLYTPAPSAQPTATKK